MSPSILHVDGDGFFAACEVAKDPSLRGLPVVVGANRGIALAMTYEAKRLGVQRGMTLREVRAVAPEVVSLDTDFATYKAYAARMYAIVERYTPFVERYSIDECFADLGGSLERAPDVAFKIKETLGGELGMTFSVGLAPTKVLAKVASKHRKPDGFVVIRTEDADAVLRETPIGKIWGIGGATTRFLENRGISTALRFKELPESWIREELSRPFLDIWNEMHGRRILPFSTEEKTEYDSMLRTRTFSRPIGKREELLAEFSRHAEVVAARLRLYALSGKEISFFLRGADLRYHTHSLRLLHPSHTPEEIFSAILERFERVYEEGRLYRAAGISISRLSPKENHGDLFDPTLRKDRFGGIWSAADELRRRYGRPVVLLASSQRMKGPEGREKQRGTQHETDRIGIPFSGEVG